LPTSDLHVTFKRSGGIFSGSRLELDVDRADLAADEARAWEEALADESFAQWPVGHETGMGADEYQYDLTIRHGGRTHELRFSESTMPAALESLVAALERRAEERLRRRRGGST